MLYLNSTQQKMTDATLQVSDTSKTIDVIFDPQGKQLLFSISDSQT